MKKAFLALGVACMIGLASCSESVDSQLDKLEKLYDQAAELSEKVKEGDTDAMKETAEVGAKVKELAEKLEKEDLTDAQKERLAKMSTNMLLQIAE